MHYLIYLALFFMSASINSEEFTLPKDPKTFAKKYQSSVLVNVLVDKQGQAKRVELVDPDSKNPHKNLAILRAKHKTYALRKSNGVPIEYWMKGVKIMFNVAPMQANAAAPASIEHSKNN